jgi:hypothetical protein
MRTSTALQLAYALTATLVLSVLAFMWLPRRLAMCNFYMFLSSVLYVNIGGAQDFWFTGDEECVPGGPSFDYTYYNTYTAIVGAFTVSPSVHIPQFLLHAKLYTCFTWE